MNVLEQIIENKRREVVLLKQSHSIDSFSKCENFSRKTLSLSQHIVNKDFGIIAEIKRKSPSGGAIKLDVDVQAQAHFYEQNGACGISILTDEKYFGGNIEDVRIAREVVNIPLLRKEFIVDEIQLFEARAAGADAVLLIGAVLNPTEAQYFTNIAHTLGLEVLYEVHAPDEVANIPQGVNMVAVNNRDLKAQQTTLQHSFNLVDVLPKGIPLISASGIKTLEDIAKLKEAGYSGALIGESILREGHLAALTKSILL